MKDNGTGGVGNYNVDSDGAATVGANIGWDSGVVRGDIQVSSITRSAYPAGSTFAYGASGDESITVNATFTMPNGDANVETASVDIEDSATRLVGETGAATDVDGTFLAQSFVADQTFPFANSPYVPTFTLQGNAVRTGLKWTAISATGNGANIVKESDTRAYDSTTFNIDPRIKMDSTGTHGFASADETDQSYVGTCTGSLVELFNKGETVCHSWYLYNARSELLSRSMSFARFDTVQCSNYGSLTPTSNQYTKISTLATNHVCDTSADTTGIPRTLHVSNTDQAYTSGTIFSVSSLLRFDQDGTGTPDNLLKTCVGVGGCPASPATVFNRGERVDYEGYLINARGTQYCPGVGVIFKTFDSTPAQANSQTITADGSCKYNAADFPLTSTEKATADTVGDPHTFQATHDGNEADSITNYGVSSLYFVDPHIQLSATLCKDNFPTENACEDSAYIISNAQTDTTHGWCHVVNVRKDTDIDTSGSAVSWAYIDPTSTSRFSGTTDTGSDGWTPTHLDLLASTPLGTWNFNCTVSFNGNSANTNNSFSVSVPAGTGGGFPGDPIRVICAPLMSWTNQVTRCTITENYLNGTARTGNANGTEVDVRDASDTLVVSNGVPTEWEFGTYWYNVTPTTTGTFHVQIRTTDEASSNPVGASTMFYVQASPGAVQSDVTSAQAAILAAITALQQNVNSNTNASINASITNINGNTNSSVNGAIANINGNTNATVLSAQQNINSNTNSSIAAHDANEQTRENQVLAAIAALNSTIANLNVTITGNFTTDNATLHSILENVTVTPTLFESATGSTGQEFFVLIFMVVAAIVIWSRSMDFLVQYAMGVLAFIPAIVWIALFLKDPWKGDIALAIFSGAVGGYLMIRTGIDHMEDQKAKRGGMPR